MKQIALKLIDRSWKPFKLHTVFQIENCKCSKVSSLIDGNIPYVGATNRNNGVIRFVNGDKNLITKGNCIAFICDGEGSVGYSIYKNEDFIGSTTVKVGRNPKLNKYNGQFITTIADTVRSKYNFGFKRNEKHLKNEILMLPVNDKDEPDFDFMESFVKIKETQKKEKYRKYLNERIELLKDFKPTETIENKEWKEFTISDLFNNKIGKSIDGNKVNRTNGKVAYITRKESNNGLDGFINYDKNYLNKVFPVITIGNETAEPFVQNFEFFTGTKVNILKPKKEMSKFVLSFIATSLKQHKTKYSYSFTINSTRLKKQIILLPINDKKEPDFDYMENYMKQLELKKINEYLKIN